MLGGDKFKGSGDGNMTGLKIIGGIVLIFCGALGGLYAARRIEQQTDFIRQYIVFLTQTETMISYCNADIIEILGSINSVPIMSPMIAECLDRMNKGQDFTSAWCDSARESCRRKLISDSDLDMICSFSEGFGSLGAEEEIGKIRLHKTMAEQRLSELQPETNTKKRLYRVVGTFCGAMAAAIII